MRCPFCLQEETKVVDSRLVSDGDKVRRRRECGQCHERFTTFECAELVFPKIVKNDGTREAFNEDKLRRGILHALEKCPVKSEDVEKAISHICQQLRKTGELEIPSKKVGGLVMNELKALDKVAYIRFASVYLSFDDINQFSTEIEKLKD